MSVNSPLEAEDPDLAITLRVFSAAAADSTVITGFAARLPVRGHGNTGADSQIQIIEVNWNA